MSTEAAVEGGLAETGDCATALVVEIELELLLLVRPLPLDHCSSELTTAAAAAAASATLGTGGVGGVGCSTDVGVATRAIRVRGGRTGSVSTLGLGSFLSFGSCPELTELFG